MQARLHKVASCTGLPWPRVWGTAPWALAALAGSLTGHRYRIYPMWRHQEVHSLGAQTNLSGGGANRAIISQHLGSVGLVQGAIARAVATGADCFLYVGGNAKAWQRWIPRHVVAVLGVESTSQTLRVFEPSSGEVFELPFASLLDQPGRGPRPEFGRWWFPLLAVVPDESGATTSGL